MCSIEYNWIYSLVRVMCKSCIHLCCYMSPFHKPKTYICMKASVDSAAAAAAVFAHKTIYLMNVPCLSICSINISEFHWIMQSRVACNHFCCKVIKLFTYTISMNWHQVCIYTHNIFVRYLYESTPQEPIYFTKYTIKCWGWALVIARIVAITVHSSL